MTGGRAEASDRKPGNGAEGIWRRNMWCGACVAGVVGGLAASWMMNQFAAGAGKSLTHAVQSDEQNAEQEKLAAEQAGKPQEDATMKAADLIVSTVTGGQHLTWEEKEKDGPIVHYAFGALMGGLYGGLAEVSGVVTTGLGSGFGSVLFAGADLVGVPALHLSGSAAGAPVNTLITPYAAHIVYGVTTDVVRRLVRTIL